MDAIRGLEDIKQRLKRSTTVGEVEDVATGKQLLEAGILSVFALPAAAFALVGVTFVCAGGVACANPLTTPFLFLFYFVPLMVPPMLLYVAVSLFF